MEDQYKLYALAYPAFNCNDCQVNTLFIREYYMVQHDLWLKALPETSGEGMLCVGCLEARLERSLTPEDFTDVPLNYGGGSDRLTSRRGDKLNSYNPTIWNSWNLVPEKHDSSYLVSLAQTEPYQTALQKYEEATKTLPHYFRSELDALREILVYAETPAVERLSIEDEWEEPLGDAVLVTAVKDTRKLQVALVGLDSVVFLWENSELVLEEEKTREEIAVILREFLEQ